MKYTFYFLFLLGSLNPVFGQDREVVIPFDSPNGDKGLSVWIYQGNIEIKAVERKDVLLRYKAVDSKLHGDMVRQGKTEGLKKISHNNTKLDISSSNNNIMIKTPEWKKKLIFYFEVPKEINVHIHYGFGGLTKIDQVRGNINVESNSGDIIATNISGLINASTNDGDITVSFVEIPKPKTMRITNVSGDLDVSIPANYKANLKLKTVLGEMYSAFDLQMEERPETEDEKEKEDYFEFSHTNNWSVGKLNGGGPEFILKTQSGNIYLRKNK